MSTVFAIVVPGFVLELLNSGVELFEGPLAEFLLWKSVRAMKC